MLADRRLVIARTTLALHQRISILILPGYCNVREPSVLLELATNAGNRVVTWIALDSD